MIERYSREKIKKIWGEKNKYQIWLDRNSCCPGYGKVKNNSW